MRQRLADLRLFWRQAREDSFHTGAIAPSSRFLARQLVQPLIAAKKTNPHQSLRILEVGPGTGEVTQAIAEQMEPADELQIVEINERFVLRLRERLTADPCFRKVAPAIQIAHSSLETWQTAEPYDFIVSSLPLNNFSAAEVENILARLESLLIRGGVLSFFEYLAIRRVRRWFASLDEKARLHGIEQSLAHFFNRHKESRAIVWNPPPAVVHHVTVKRHP